MKRVLIVLSLLFILNISCSGENSESTNSMSSSNEIAIAEMANQNQSLGSNDIENALVRDQSVSEYFASLCAACHGPNREGLIGPALLPSTLLEPDEVYLKVLHNGRYGTLMMPYGGGPKLSDQEVQTLVTWLKTVDP